MRITHHYSACVSIETRDVTILCDPWFTQGAYNGSWFHFPLYEKPLERLPKADLIYISHLHPDHYDPVFLRGYMTKWPEARVIIQDREPNYLSKMMHKDGIPYEYWGTGNRGETWVHILPDCDTLFDVDSALIVKEGNQSVINLNDCEMTPGFMERVKKACPDPTALLLCYQGASAYPQVYLPMDDPLLAALAEGKRQRRLGRYLQICNEIGAEVNIPFAGQYVLGGRLIHLNAFRGNGDDTDVLDYDSRSQVLATDGTIDLDTGNLSVVRTRPYPKRLFREREMEVIHEHFDYEKGFSPVIEAEETRVAFEKACQRAKILPDVNIAIAGTDGGFMVMNPKEHRIDVSSDLPPTPRWVAYPDPRLFMGCVKRAYHWNNAYVGSLYPIRMAPMDDDTQITAFLNGFHV